MNQIDKDWNSFLESDKRAEASREQAAAMTPGYIKPGSHVLFSLHEWQFDGRPYVMATCGSCRTTLRTEALDYVWKHCGRKDAVPANLNAQLEAKQIKMGLRQAKSFVDRLLGKSQPEPNLSNF
jgi:hypothetical protein